MSKAKKHNTRRVPARFRRPDEDHVDRFLDQYTAAAGPAALVELRMRMVAEVIPETERIAHEPAFQTVEDAVCSWLESHNQISPQEREQLRTCRALRNKLFHGNFHRARERVQEAGAPPMRGGVTSIKLPDDPKEMLGALIEQRGATFVADSGSKRGIFGWLLELGAAGDFVEAEKVFRRTDALVEALAQRVSDVMLEQDTARRQGPP